MHIKSIYHKLPYQGKVALATLNGVRLNYWRYNNRKKFIHAIAERDNWTETDWAIWQEKRVKEILKIAAFKVPFYHDYWKEKKGLENEAYLDLNNWPVLKKDEIRNAPKDFVNRDYNLKKLEHIQTSGTTGKPMSLYYSREATSLWFTMFEHRCRTWNGVSDKDRWANIGGQLVTAYHRDKPPFWVWNHAMNQLYLSSYHITPKNTRHYISAIREHKLKYLIGYTSSVYNIAKNALEQKINCPKLSVVLTNAEPLFPYQRETISAAFQCKVVQTYSSSEQAFASSECLDGKMYVWPDAGKIEVFDNNDHPLPDGKRGRFIITGLINEAMPLIRYDLGDVGIYQGYSIPRNERQYDLPTLGEITGRFDDIIKTKDGREVGRLDPVFKADIRIKEAQVIQKSIENIIVKVVKAEAFDISDEKKITERLKERVGEINVTIEDVESIPRLPNGKFKSVVCEI